MLDFINAVFNSEEEQLSGQSTVTLNAIQKSIFSHCDFTTNVSTSLSMINWMMLMGYMYLAPSTGQETAQSNVNQFEKPSVYGFGKFSITATFLIPGSSMLGLITTSLLDKANVFKIPEFIYSVYHSFTRMNSDVSFSEYLQLLQTIYEYQRASGQTYIATVNFRNHLEKTKSMSCLNTLVKLGCSKADFPSVLAQELEKGMILSQAIHQASNPAMLQEALLPYFNEKNINAMAALKQGYYKSNDVYTKRVKQEKAIILSQGTQQAANAGRPLEDLLPNIHHANLTNSAALKQSYEVNRKSYSSRNNP